MAELPELRDNANRNGGSTMMLSDCQQANSSEGVFVLGEAAFSAAKTVSRSASATRGSTATDRDARAAGRRGSADSRGARWASLSSSDREIFNRWARWVIALYSVLILGLLAMMLLGAHTAADRGAAATSPAVEHGSPDASLAESGRPGK
jgi:hypothetical protein